MTMATEKINLMENEVALILTEEEVKDLISVLRIFRGIQKRDGNTKGEFISDALLEKVLPLE